MNKKIIALILTGMSLQGCAGDGGMNKQGGGALIGGVTGALLGSRFGKGSGQLFATGIGAVAGSLVGSHVGNIMDENDRRILELRSQQALESVPTGSSVEWNNPDSGHHGYITPTQTSRNNVGQYCREYTQVIVVGGREQKAYGRACRMPDGHWQIVQQ